MTGSIELTSRSLSIIRMLLGIINELKDHSELLCENARKNGDMDGQRSVRAIADRLSNLHNIIQDMVKDPTLTHQELKSRLQSATQAVLSVQRAHQTMFGARA